MTSRQISIGVIGGGIGGLTAALSLLRAGLDVHVYEQAPEAREVGAGIQVSPNASRILERLGLAETLAMTAMRETPASIGNDAAHAGSAESPASHAQGTISAVATHMQTARSGRRIRPGGTGTPIASALALL